MNDTSPTAPSVPADAGLHSAPDEVWEQVRADYLAGWSAPACCRRHGVGLSTLRKRAAEEGWRRTDQPWTTPNGLDRDDEGLALEESVDGDLEQIPLGELSVVAFQRMMRAVLHGNAMEALRWRRVHNVIQSEAAEIERRQWLAKTRQARAEEKARAATEALMKGLREETRIMEADIRRREADVIADPIDGIDDIDGIDGVFSSSPASPPSTGVLPGLPGGAPFMGPP
ncbi:hypothetical protein [Brevundimonas sp. M20]|uniref:hypothetical protein n=1 Tax=Brevundimonas sp. M20 TaxID=2591463 RepID=UPI0011476FE7|nr:hypothetical protein [Brevundimonas sp. M20]QDH72400.1 hypothetical protein FKQ52_02525 [Brevundimonas sp. M20]